MGTGEGGGRQTSETDMAMAVLASVLHISAKMRVDIGGSQLLPLPRRLLGMPRPLDREMVLVSLVLVHARSSTCIKNPP
jgi:hypothetical protein